MARPSRYPRDLREREARAMVESIAQGEYASEFETTRTKAGELGSPSQVLSAAAATPAQRPGKLPHRC
ncbi:hypothetical protein [Nocardioides sp.]|uniref:hypothetical protein n=1 Tax=Nocardioides sp. TaxID=35761 RepID=UPI003783609D